MTAADLSPAFDPRSIGGDFECGPDGIWHARESESISYSEDGNADCFELEDHSYWFAHRAACLLAAMRRFPSAGPLFDIGGGNGFVTRALIDQGIPAVLVEPGRTGAGNGRKRGLPAVICATLAAAHFNSGTLPAVGLFDVLEHLDDDAGFLAEVHRCLTPGGRLYLTVPAFSWLWSDDDVTAGHYRRYRMSSLEKKLRAGGFTPLFSSYLFSFLPFPLFFLRSVASLFGHRSLRPETYRGLHRDTRGGLVGRLLSAETRAIERGRRIPFGSSCFVVAEKFMHP